MPIGNIGFRFVDKFSGGSFFGGRVFGIQYNDKRNCKFYEDGDIHNYTLYSMQAYSTKQIDLYNDNEEEFSRYNWRDEDDDGNGDDGSYSNEPE